ncbi:MAG: glycoside hydrolase, partial [Cyclobacteriaceae bacterium]|nr:glycoside hydrolase [Cyclobacteriaceae bacterium]
MGVNHGGVWKTIDYGRTWKPIFDDQATGSVGDVAVALSNPNVVYVASGEGIQRPDLSIGDGVYKSTDAGNTWTNTGLRDGQQIGGLAIDPQNENNVFAAVLGHPYGANTERGVFRTRDGGKNWERVLYIDENTGAAQVTIDPKNSNIIFADLWAARQGPWENGAWQGQTSGLYKSTDGGSTWKKIVKGLPDQGLGRIGFCIAPSDPNRMYATVDARQAGGIYRSDDAGESWYRTTSDSRIWGRGSDFAELKVHPLNPDMVFSANVASYKSTDGGKTWYSFKGAPGGDDYHRFWINPLQPDIMFLDADQGVVITVNGGRTWSSWYNQPTAQLYHISTDNQFPYWVYGGQQESGAIGVASRGPGGQISFRDWMGVGADEYAYVAADPKNTDLIYGGRLTRFNKKTGQTQNVAPEALRSGNYRMVRTLPVLFHPADDNMLLFATNVLWKSMTGGDQWEVISPDLTRKDPEVPVSVGIFKTQPTIPQRGVIYSVSGSPKDKNIIWIGTDDGLVYVTTDGGKNWKNVTPPALTAWDKISQIDAGHFDTQTAYFSVNAIRKDNLRAIIYRTKDGGATWSEITTGLPSEPVNVVREDVKQPGLLFAGTEKAAYFSTDDGNHWQSLRNNMPATSIRDLVVHENDVVVGTHGRSIWIMDDISPLRHLARATASTSAYLVPPATATRVRFNMFGDTPLPPEEPGGQNPPDGAALDYVLKSDAKEVTLEVLDANKKIVHQISSKDAPEFIDSTALQYPTYWLRPQQKIATKKGHHRYIWDISYPAPQGSKRELSIAANYMNTATGPKGVFVPPGNYIVRLTVDGVISEQPISVKLDPRVTTPTSAIELQSRYSILCQSNYDKLQALREEIDAKLNDPKVKWAKGSKEALIAIRGEGQPENPNIEYGSIYATTLDKETIVGLQDKLLHTIALMQSADVQPTQTMIQATEQLEKRTSEMVERYKRIK